MLSSSDHGDLHLCAVGSHGQGYVTVGGARSAYAWTLPNQGYTPFNAYRLPAISAFFLAPTPWFRLSLALQPYGVLG